MKKKKLQEEFLKNELEPRIMLAKGGKIKLFFVDAAHFVHGAFLGYVWCKVRLFLPTPSGRKRYNVLGAIDSINHQLIRITNDSYINAESFCQLLYELYNQNYKQPISLILDNAKYQKCELVTKTAYLLGIELLYLPSYSPNLNIIERLWKWLKKDCLYCRYYEKFNFFKKAIDNSLEKIDLKEVHGEIASLLNLKFQLFNKTHIMTN
jgi:transposase